MGQRSHYKHGTFSWVDLATTDLEGAKSFYGSLLGWSYVEGESSDGSPYLEATVSGDAVAGIYSQPEAQREQGVPPFWLGYVTVDDVDDTARRVRLRGGAVHVEPHDVLDSGRMAIVGDPAGAVFGIWQARGSVGARRVNDPGCLTWNELNTGDVAGASEFYPRLFDWRIAAVDTGDAPPYWTIEHDGGARGRNGGVRELGPGRAGVPSHWLAYFTVTSVADALETATGAGGRAIAGPIDLPTGRIAVLADPQGAVLGIFEGDVDD